jgi:hypothetical protein
MNDVILLVWLLADLVWSAAIFAGVGYAVFWKGHSGWWFIPAFLLAASLGGDKLYKRLSERLRGDR